MKIDIKKDGLEGDTLKFATLMEDVLTKAFAEVKPMTEKEVDDLISKAMKEKGLTEEEGVSIKSMAETIRKQAIEIDKIKAKGVETPEENLLETLKASKDELKAIQKARTGLKEFVIKAAGVTTTATSGSTRSIVDSTSAAAGQRLGGSAVTEIRRARPFILDYVNVGNTDASVLIWFDELPKEGDFAITAEGATKPMVQYRFERKSASYQKAAGYTVLTDEFDRDFPGLVTTIKRLMRTDLRLKTASLILADIISQAPTFSYTGLNAGIDNADNYAAIYAAVTQARTLYFDPNVLFLNAADEAKMRLTKSSTGEWISPPLEDLFDAIVIDPGVTAGTFVLGDLSMFNVDFYGDVIVKIGYVNDDLIKNQYTVVVEQFFYDYISTNKLGALVKGTFSTIKTALETP